MKNCANQINTHLYLYTSFKFHYSICLWMTLVWTNITVNLCNKQVAWYWFELFLQAVKALKNNTNDIVNAIMVSVTHLGNTSIARSKDVSIYRLQTNWWTNVFKLKLFNHSANLKRLSSRCHCISYEFHCQKFLIECCCLSPLCSSRCFKALLEFTPPGSYDWHSSCIFLIFRHFNMANIAKELDEAWLRATSLPTPSLKP